jgi:GxxExxY protein
MSTRTRRLSQAEFGELAYEVMGCVFAIRDELGRLFDEKLYKHELAYRYPSVQREVPITVWHRSFAKTYYLDVLVADGGLFEFKMAETLVPKHRAQTLHYLYLADLGHGKLVNLRLDAGRAPSVRAGHRPLARCGSGGALFPGSAHGVTERLGHGSAVAPL